MNRDHIMVDLNGYIRKFFKNAELTLFGSSSNGFAFRHSDLDISLTFTDKPSADGLNCIQVRTGGGGLQSTNRPTENVNT